MAKRCADAGCGVLIVDDDAEMARALGDLLVQNGVRAVTAFSAAEALDVLRKDQCVCLALVDLVMPLVDGMTLMERIRENDPEVSIIIMTGYGTVDSAVEAMKRGAEDYITKPFDEQLVLKKVGRVLELYGLREQVRRLEKDLGRHEAFSSIIFASPTMRRLLEKASAAAACELPVLLVGETGTGKELLARALHQAGRRANGPFIPVNCSALPHDLVESELFGHRRGAFTGASTDYRGLFLAAQNGTIFLDEISEMPREAQAKLLRLLDSGEFRPLGSTQVLRADVRILAATNRPLKDLCGKFLREDLYYRISTLTLEIPPLRSRREDIYALTNHFAQVFGGKFGRAVGVDNPAWKLLLEYSFPGNVRELENIISSVIATSCESPQTISAKDLRPILKGGDASVGVPVPEETALSMESLERLAIQQALRISGGNRTKAAEVLGISRASLYRKISSAGPADGDSE